MTCRTVLHDWRSGVPLRECGGSMVLRRGRPSFWVCLNPECGTAVLAH